jgi:hypothetical protein
MTFLENLLKENEPINDAHRTINFYHSEGICRGASFWFLYLFQKTAGHFATEKEHFIAVARQFINGVPRQAALLQTFCNAEAGLLDMKKIGAFEISLPQIMNHAPDLIKNIRSLSPQAYYLGVNDHGIVYVKFSESMGYIWDPAIGAIDCEGIDQAKFLVDYFHAQYSKKGDKWPVMIEAYPLTQDTAVSAHQAVI